LEEEEENDEEDNNNEQHNDDCREYEVEKILKKRIGVDGRLWVRVKWLGYAKPSWEPFINVRNALEKYEEFEIENLSGSTTVTTKTTKRTRAKRTARQI
jgi:hypothetical protein